MATDFSTGVQLVGHGLGDFAGAASVQKLQQALVGLSMAAGWPAVNPGPVTGDVSPQTVMAVSAVVANLGGKISSKVKTALQLGLALAATSTTAMGAAKTLIAQYATYLQPAVLGLTAAYTKSSAPPTPPAPPTTTTPPFFNVSKVATFKPFTVATRRLPAGAIQTRTKTGSYRVAVPSSQATGLGGPSFSLGEEFFELPSRPSQSPGAILVTESEFDKKTGEKPFYKKPLYWAILGGVVVAGGGAWWFMRG